LNAKLEAKIADFGLSKAFNTDNEAHVSTNALVGTPGYVDPEYVRQSSALGELYMHTT
jgi:serine/threonine protein kinase